jgi:hypothetical protein
MTQDTGQASTIVPAILQPLSIGLLSESSRPCLHERTWSSGVEASKSEVSAEPDCKVSIDLRIKVS